MQNNINTQDTFEYMQKMSARRQQEIVETMRDYQNCLFQYTGPTIVEPDCVLFTGDYILGGKDGFNSVRGTHLELTPDEFMEQVNAQGGFQAVFTPGDLNAPNAVVKFQKILKEMRSQAAYGDADSYLGDNANPASKYAIYSSPNDSGFPMTIIEMARGLSLVHCLAENADFDNFFKDPYEITYEDFNPGALELDQEMQETVNPERQNQTEYREKIQENYVDLKEARVERPVESVPDNYDKDKLLNDSSKSAYERMMLYNDLTQIEEQDPNKQQPEAAQDDELISPLASKMSKYM